MKNNFLKILKNIIDWLTYHYEKRLPKKKNNLPYNSLTPTENAEKVEDYLNTLDWALNNRNKVKNIAIAGPYGSGKSSVIQTFQNKNKYNKDYRFLNISLATFKEDKKEQKEEQKNDILRLIELSILQQLFFHEKDSKIPDSRFKKIKNNKRKYLWAMTLGLFVFIISFLNIIFPDFLLKFAFFKLAPDTFKIFHIISVIIVLLGSLFAIFKSIRLLKGLTIKKIGISKTTIEIDDSISKSILNNHIDEILYFFEVTNYNVVVFEDLDRFEQTDVFTKLREINLLINNSKKIEKDIVFIYAIRDDMFLDKDRTKFFDFMIPIIPVINSSNSNEKLLNIIKTNNYKISDDLIENISLFIDDMRLLYNIMNEYHIYSRRLNKTLNQDNLLSMVVYKNIYPNDFTELSQNKGELYKIIINKRKYIKTKINEIDDKISRIKKKIEVKEGVKLRNIKELRLIYISKLIEKITQSNLPFKGFFINGRIIHNSIATEDSIFDSIRKLKSVRYIYQQNNQQTNFNYDFKNIELEVDENFTYQEREQLILNDKQLEQLKEDIEKNEIEKASVKKHKLKNLVSGKKIIIESNKESQKELIGVLLRNGYIDENYLDYISIFYEGSLSKNDHQFLINVKTQLASDFDYPLQKKGNLIKRINEYDFEKEYIFNYDLLDFLLSSKEYPQKRDKLFNQLKGESNNSVKFIDGFVDYTSNVESFIKQLCENWVNIWSYIESKSNFTKKNIDKYFKLIIEYAEVDSIVEIMRNFKTSISNNKNFLLLISNTDKLKEIIKKLDIKFSVLNESAPQELIEFVYSRNHYSISLQSIEFILNYKEISNSVDFNSKNYSVIQLSKLENLIKYIEGNINEYLSSVYFKINGNKNEQENYFIQLLNNEEILFENKEKIIAQNTTIISDINKIKDLEIINSLLNESKVLVNWENLIKVYVENENIIIEEVVSFINNTKNSVNLSKKKINSKFPDEDTAKAFIRTLLLNEGIDNISYSHILLSVPYIYPSLSFENLTIDKVKLLINNGILMTNSTNFDSLKTNFKALHILLIEKDTNKLIEEIDSYKFDNEDIFNLIKSDKISILIKGKIIDNFEETLFTNDEKLLTQIGKLLLSHNNLDIDNSLVKSVLKDSNLNVLSKINLFNKKNSIYDKGDIDDFLNSIEEPYSIIPQNGKRPLLDNNKINKEFAENLQLKNYISQFSIKRKGIRISTFRNKE